MTTTAEAWKAAVARESIDARAEARERGEMRYLMEHHLVSAVEIAIETGCPGKMEFCALAASVWADVQRLRPQYPNDIRDPGAPKQ